MNANLIPAAVVGGVLASILALAGFAHLAGRRADGSLVRLMRDNAALDSRIRSTEKEIAALDRDCAELQAALNALPAHPVVSPGAAALKSRRGIGDLLAADPPLADLEAKAFRASLAEQYGPLYRRLELSADQIAKFESLMVEHQREVMDTLASGSSQGLKSGDAAIVTLLLQENEELGTSQMALLGDAGYQQLQQFIRAQPVQGMVRQVAAAVALSPSPLTGQQADQLSQILENSNSRFQNGGRADPAAIDWSVVLPQAQSVLSASQFQALQGQYQEALFAPILAQFRQQESAGK